MFLRLMTLRSYHTYSIQDNQGQRCNGADCCRCHSSILPDERARIFFQNIHCLFYESLLLLLVRQVLLIIIINVGLYHYHHTTTRLECFSSRMPTI